MVIKPFHMHNEDARECLDLELNLRSIISLAVNTFYFVLFVKFFRAEIIVKTGVKVDESSRWVP